MQTAAIAAANRAASKVDFNTHTINGRPDLEFAAALQKVSPKQQAKAKATATDFEGMFLNSMFSQMTAGLQGDGPFGNTPGTGVWRSMLTEQYSKSFARAGGVGIASEVYRSMIMKQAKAQAAAPTTQATS
jgi:Rod binding domain-containing protein